MAATTTFQAVVTDLDGTVVHHDGTVSAATVNAAAELAARAIPLIAATARTPAGIAALESLAPYLTMAACCGGALGWSPATRQLLWLETIDAASVDQIVRFTVECLPDAGIAAYDGQRLRMTEAYAAQRGATRRGVTEVRPAADIAEHPICAMSVCHPGKSSEELLHDLTAATVGIDPAPTITYSTTKLVDIAPANINKSTGVSRALASLNIRPAHAIVFGDMPNDLPMFGLCGHAVAVANAHPDVLTAATTVAACVHDDGFSRVLSELGVISRDQVHGIRTKSACECMSGSHWT